MKANDAIVARVLLAFASHQATRGDGLDGPAFQWVRLSWAELGAERHLHIRLHSAKAERRTIVNRREDARIFMAPLAACRTRDFV